MTERRCGTCRWHDSEGFDRYHGKITGGMADMGFCRRFPPMPDFIRRWHMWQASQASTEAPDELVFRIWPETGDHAWCGEWQAQESPAP